MSFDWSAFYDIGKDSTSDLLAELGNQGKPIPPLSQENQARLRSCISRVYYSAFCLTRNYLRDDLGYSEMRKHSQTNEPINLHKRIPEILGNESSKDLRKVGADLKKLRYFRNKADYEDTFQSLIKDTKFCLKLSESVISTIKRLQS